jgi:hypothetical protein
VERRPADSRCVRKHGCQGNEARRTIDGFNNNLDRPDWGSTGSTFIRLTYSDYSDGIGAPSGDRRPSPRAISNAVVAQPGPIPNEKRASDFIWLWGQFLDHDLDLTPTISPVEPFDIPVPTGDPDFDPEGTGTQTIPLDRSLYGADHGIREQLNVVTAWIDASNVYGSDSELASSLRTLDGTGRLKTSEHDLLPFDPADPGLFLAGDSRANEQVGLTAMHTLFVREHNYWADRFRRENRRLAGDDIYEMARMMVGAEIQSITYREFLPVLLGSEGLARYRGYQAGVDPTISNEFATASYRFGHSMVSPQLLRLGSDQLPLAEGPLSLSDAFFNPVEITGRGIEPLLRGFSRQVAQRVDSYIVDELRNFLFGQPGAGGFDLASLNIQRGRDHGLPGYNAVRRDMGLVPANDFSDITPDVEVRTRLASVYPSVEDIDLWVGGLAEPHMRGALVGETIHAVLADQFERLRDGDRFWYQVYLPGHLLALVEEQSLATIIRRNTDVGREIQDDVFVVTRNRPGLRKGRR